jgi:hypothetical protein
MKKYLNAFTIILIAFCFHSYSQNNNNNFTNPDRRHAELYSDSLKGFDEKKVKTELQNHNVLGLEAENYVELLKRDFIKNKYPNIKLTALSSIANPLQEGLILNQKRSGGINFINALTPCTNMDFESGFPGTYTNSSNVSGWTVSSQIVTSCNTSTVWTPGSLEFSVHTTPLAGVPLIGTLQQSPLGGSKIVQLNNYTPNQYSTMLSRTISVTSGNTIFQFAYAGIWQDGFHNCCEQSLFIIQFRTCQGAIIPCLTYSFNATQAPSICNNFPVHAYSPGGFSNSYSWTNWRIKNIDLSQYIGSCLEVEVISSDCIFSGHYGTVFFDAICNPSPASPFISGSNNTGNISLCPGTNTAVITAPYGYESYQWYPSYPAIQNTLSILTTTILSQSVYTVVYHNGNPLCTQSQTYAVSPSSVNITGIGAGSTCSLIAGGSASVQVAGSNLGYTYSWINTTNSVVGTTSAVANLSLGSYSVIVTALNAPACGSAIASTTITATPPQTSYFLKPYCGSQVYFLPVSGSNFQWYNGSVTISSGQGGTAPGYTINTPVNNSFYTLSYLNAQGCKDSTMYNIISSSPGNITALVTPTICPDLPVNAVINLNPASFSPPVLYSFTLVSMNNTPSYSTVSSFNTANTYTVNNLVSGYSYSINTFDGSCYANTVITLPSVIPLVHYTLSPSTAHFCSGNSVLVNLTYTSNPYSISWSPTTAIQYINQYYNGTFSATINPTVAMGLTSTLVYTASITENPSNCIFTLTLPVTVSHFATPTISPIAPLCSNSGTYSINAQPVNGIFISPGSNSNTPGITSGGIITPSLTSIGLNMFLYLLSAPGCSVSSTGSFMVNAPPVITIKTQSSICLGEITTLTASGGNIYTWNNGVNNAVNVISPQTTTSYTVIGTNIITSCSNTQAATIQVNLCSGLEELNTDSGFRMYPNPTNAQLFIETKVFGKLFIYNSLGQLIFEKMITTTKDAINVSEISNGVYFVKIVTLNSSEVLRLIKN